MKHGKAARLLFQLPSGCRVFVAIAPANQWGWNEVLQNKMVYLLDTLVWMKTKDAQKKLPQQKPKLFVPQFIKDKQQSELAKNTVAADVDTIKDLLSRPRK